jgi:diguanylate cyclase (GGDEF)-like protein
MEHLALQHPSSKLGRVTLSIGVACNKDLDNDPAALIAAADAALYRAKRAGRNRVNLHLGLVPN